MYFFQKKDFFVHLVIFLIGGFFVFLGGRSILMHVLDPMTQKLDGVVIQSHTKKSVKASNNRTYISNYFKYKYNYKGKTYYSIRHDFMNGWTGASAGNHNYQVGDGLTVYINPNNPHQSIIEKGWAWNNALQLLIGWALLWRLHAIIKEALINRKISGFNR